MISRNYDEQGSRWAGWRVLGNYSLFPGAQEDSLERVMQKLANSQQNLSHCFTFAAGNCLSDHRADVSVVVLHLAVHHKRLFLEKWLI